MASTYQVPGTMPLNTYPNTLAYNPRAAYPPPNDSSSADSVISKEAGLPPYKNMNYYNASDVRVDIRHISRTPSPTPSEAAELKKEHLFDFQAMKSWRYWVRKEWRCASSSLPLCYSGSLRQMIDRVLHRLRDCVHLRPSVDRLSQANCQLVAACCKLDARVSVPLPIDVPVHRDVPCATYSLPYHNHVQED